MTEIKDGLIVVSVEQIGTMLPGTNGHMIFLNDSFASKLISLCGGGLQLLRQEGKTTEYECPICHNGRIRVKKLIPDYSGGCRPVPSTMRHVGDTIDCDCTNPECKAIFFGSYTFMYID
jgi:hypothetical protein